MAGTVIKVDGLDELQRQLRRVKNTELDEEMKEIHQDIAKEIARRAAPKVPIGETMRLWKSVRSAGTVRDAIGRAGGASVPYAPVIHWGWAAHGIAARPFLQDAAREIETDVVDRYDRHVADMLARVIG